MGQESGRTPVVGVLACQKQRANGSTYSRVNDILTEALVQGAGVVAVLVPALPGMRGLLSGLDGLVLPGSGSFVHPSRYSGGSEVEGREYDHARDEVALELLREAEDLPGLPVLASCRGMQELAVSRGGRLAGITATEVPHRMPAEDRWAPAHELDIRQGGFLATIARDGVAVNSAHTDRVLDAGEDVFVEATAPDGVIEAVSVGWPERFVVGIQWHFERRTEESPVDGVILAEFGRRCRERVISREKGEL